MELSRDLLEVLSALNAHHVEYLIGVPASLGDVPTNVLSRDLLIRNKKAVGRPQDVADVQNLEKAAKANAGVAAGSARPKK